MTATGTVPQRATAAAEGRDATAARLAVVAGAVGAALAVLQLVMPPMVPPQQFSAPFTPTIATVVAVVLFLHHLAVIPVLVVVARLGAPVGLARAGGAIASIGLVGVAIAELVSITAAHEQGDTPLTDLVSTGYTVPTLLMGLGEVLLGIAVVRAGQRLRGMRVVPLVAGVDVFVVLIPAVVVGGAIATVALGVWSLLYTVLGVAVLRTR